MALRPRIKRKTGSATSKKRISKKKSARRVVKKKSTNSTVKSIARGGRGMPGNRGFELAGNYHFLVEVGGDVQGAFTRVSGLESTTEIIEYRDGSDIQLHKRPGRTHYANIILYRGVSTDDALWQWRKSVVDGQVERRDGSIILLNESHEPIVRYNFTAGWPCRWRSSGLDATGNETVIEELEIAIESLERND